MKTTASKCLPRSRDGKEYFFNCFFYTFWHEPFWIFWWKEAFKENSHLHHLFSISPLLFFLPFPSPGQTDFQVPHYVEQYGFERERFFLPSVWELQRLFPRNGKRRAEGQPGGVRRCRAGGTCPVWPRWVHLIAIKICMLEERVCPKAAPKPENPFALRIEASQRLKKHECLCNAGFSCPFHLQLFFQIKKKTHPAPDKAFSVSLIQQKEHPRPSKPKLPIRNSLLTHASAQKTLTVPRRSPTLAVFMWRHLRERRAAPKRCSIWSPRSWVYPRCHFQKCNRAAAVGKLIRRLRLWRAAGAISQTPASRGSPTPAPDLPPLFTPRIRHARGMPMIRPVARHQTRPPPSSASAPVELRPRRRTSQSQRPRLSPWWSRTSLTAAATSGERLTSTNVWKRRSTQKPSRCQAISPPSSKWMLRNF